MSNPTFPPSEIPSILAQISGFAWSTPLELHPRPQEQLLFSARRRARSALEKNSAEELRACSEAWGWGSSWGFFGSDQNHVDL